MHRFIVSLVALSSIASANVERPLPLSRFVLESEGKFGAGKIVVEGRQDDRGQVVALTIGAFGKRFQVPSELLSKLRGMTANGVRLVLDGGWDVGSVHVQFQSGDTFATTKEAVVSVAADGQIFVSGVSERKG